jgi:DNA-binding response OmpR family regulator
MGNLKFPAGNGHWRGGVSGTPTILLIEEDDETRRPLVHNLRGAGYRVIIALDVDDALERVGGGGVPAGMVPVNLVGKAAAELLEAGRRVREHANYDGHTPLVVMREKYGKDVEGTEANVGGNDWVFYRGEEPGQLRNLLARLLPALPQAAGAEKG